MEYIEFGGNMDILTWDGVKPEYRVDAERDHVVCFHCIFTGK